MRDPYQATLLGLVEVKASLANLNKEARVEVGKACHSLVTGGSMANIRTFSYLLGTVHTQNKRVVVVIKKESMQVFCGEELMTEHGLTNVSTLVIVPYHNGRVVYIGNCKRARKRIAVVVDLYSASLTKTFVAAYKEVKEEGQHTYQSGYDQAEVYDPPLPPMQSHDRPLPQMPTNDRPLPQMPTNDRPLPQMPTNDRPLPQMPTNDHPLPQMPINDRPLPQVPTNNRPLPQMPTNDSPLPQMPTNDHKLPQMPTNDRPLPQMPNIDRPLPQMPTNDCPLPQMPTNDRPLPRIPTSDRPLPQMPTNDHPLPQMPTSDRPLPQMPTSDRPLPQPSTQLPIQGRPLPNLPMSKHPLPELPSEGSPATDPIYQEIRTYENVQAVSTPPPFPQRYVSVQDIAREGGVWAKEQPIYEVDDWSEDDENFYENTGNYYLTLGLDQEAAEQLYLTSSELKEIKQEYQHEQGKPTQDDRSDEEEIEVEEEETLPESTLEEDMQSFIKDEFNFKNTIWRIREAKPMLSRGLCRLLKGTETLADIHNDMYIELYEGYKSCSRIAEVFLSRTDQLERYKYYLLNSPKILNLIQKQPEEVKQMFPKLNEDVQSSWKRLLFYLRSMEKLMVVAPPSDQPSLQIVVDLLKDLNRQGDSGIIIESVHGAPFSLYECVPLLLHSSFKIRNATLEDLNTPCHLMLFQRVLILTAPKDDGYHYLSHLPLASLKLLPSTCDNQRSFVLETKMGERYGVKSTSEEKIQVWVERIKSLITK